MEREWTQFSSTEDESINFVRRGATGGLEEARLVWRGADDLTVYLSAQTGCAQACRMCWLTTSKQGRADDVTAPRIFEQARVVLDAAPQALGDRWRAIRTLNFAFMARGEPLASHAFVAGASTVFAGLAQLAGACGRTARIKVSTILPTVAGDVDLAQALGRDVQPDLYWSMYSADEGFRARWLPHALPVRRALGKLRAWQDATHKIPRIHFALIAGENDRGRDFAALVAALQSSRLRCDFNLVRYNPPTPEHGVESPLVDQWARDLAAVFPDADVEVVSRVGPDVAASCGMFAGRDLVPLRRGSDRSAP